jgi:hypothetical protein
MAVVMGIAEIIDKAGKRRTKPEKVGVLQEHSSPALKDFFTYLCDPRITFLIPSSRPPFKRREKSMDLQSEFIRDINKKKLNYFISIDNVPVHNIKQAKREQMFLQMLEAIDPDDAELLLQLINKELPKGISLPVVKDYIPTRSENW